MILTCEAAHRLRWLRGALGQGAVPPAEARARTGETWTPSAATRLQMTVLQLRVEGEEDVRQHFQQAQQHVPRVFFSRTLIHVVKVLVQLFISGFLVVLLLYHVSPVMDVMSNGHLLHAALRVFNRSPGLLDLSTTTNV